MGMLLRKSRLVSLPTIGLGPPAYVLGNKQDIGLASRTFRLPAPGSPRKLVVSAMQLSSRREPEVQGAEVVFLSNLKAGLAQDAVRSRNVGYLARFGGRLSATTGSTLVRRR
jgi:hypothetical protein